MSKNLKNMGDFSITALSKLTALPSLAALVLTGAATIAAAAPVTLVARDGSSRIEGELVEFDGETYQVRTVIGDIIVDSSQVDCEGPGCPSEELRTAAFAIAGQTSVMETLIPALLDDYTFGIDSEMIFEIKDAGTSVVQVNNAEGEEVGSIDLLGGTSTSALNSIIDETALLAVANRPVTDQESRSFTRAGLGSLNDPEQQVVLALDGLLIVTAPDNPIDTISQTDIARVFSGQITNWSQLGGLDAPINLYIQSDDSGTTTVFNQLVMQPAGFRLSRNADVLNSDNEVSDAVVNDPNGIGFSSFSSIRNAKGLSIRGVCGIQTAPSQFSIKTEEYPLTRRLTMYRPNGQTPALVNNFIDYIGSVDAQAVVADAGYVDQGLSLLASREQGLRYASAMWPTDAEASLRELGDMVQELLPASRLSLTFRFELGSSRLDARSLRDIESLADVLAAGEVFANKELLLVGFTDSIGPGAANKALSLQRADVVRRTLESVAIPGSLDTTPIRVLGYGEASPLSCNETATGRQVNRRVEVWVRETAR